MGVSTDGQICLGIVFDEDYEFPWEDEDIKVWWEEVRGYEKPFEIYDDSGRKLGVTQDQVNEYHQHSRDWQEANPLPVELVNYCSGDYPMYILAVPSSVINASRGFPVEISPDLTIKQEELEPFISFTREYLPELSLEVRWYLSSYWG